VSKQKTNYFIVADKSSKKLIRHHRITTSEWRTKCCHCSEKFSA